MSLNISRGEERHIILSDKTSAPFSLPRYDVRLYLKVATEATVLANMESSAATVQHPSKAAGEFAAAGVFGGITLIRASLN